MSLCIVPFSLEMKQHQQLHSEILQKNNPQLTLPMYLISSKINKVKCYKQIINCNDEHDLNKHHSVIPITQIQSCLL